MIYSMKCGGCGYSYRYQGIKYEWECCPVCGYGTSFQEFVESGSTTKQNTETFVEEIRRTSA